VALIDDLRATLSVWGLENLASWLVEQEQASKDPLQIVTELRQRPEYQQRFPAMQALQDAAKRNNMPSVTENNYLQMETAYRTALQDSGLPEGMFDSADDFVALLTNDVDPTEVRERVAAAKIAVDQTDPYVVSQLRDMYGISTTDLMAYALAPDKNASYIEKVATSAMIAGLGQRQGLAAEKGSWERYAQDAINQSMSQGQIVDAVAGAANLSATQSRLAAIEGEQFTSSDALDVTINKDAGKVLKSQQRAAREKARFAGTSGITTQSLQGGSTL
jgi:hypothetical protein